MKSAAKKSVAKAAPARKAAKKPERPVRSAPAVAPARSAALPAPVPVAAKAKEVTRPARTASRPSPPATSAGRVRHEAPPLDANFLVASRKRLQAKREEIVALYRSDLKSGQESNDSPTEDIVDRANNAYTRELTYSISDSERALLLQIDEALARIDAGTYGICVHDGNPIARERLEAIPWARFCIESQELAEKGLLPES